MENHKIDIPLDGVGQTGATPREPTSRIDIPLDSGRGKQQNMESGSRIDIPLAQGKAVLLRSVPTKTVNSEINAEEMEMVNRHHDEIKELHRRAREQDG